MYDIVIVSHNKDFNKIKYVVEYAEKNLTDFESYHLILANSISFTELDEVKSKTNKPIFVHDENDVLKLDFNRVCWRPNWIYQILLKMFQNVTDNDNFLILESDGIINKKLSFFENDKTKLYLGRDAYWEPYFVFNNLLNIPNRYPFCLISEVMMYDKKMIKKLLEHCNCETVYDFIDNFIYKNLNGACYPADYELYGNFLYNFYPNDIVFEHFNYSLNGLHRSMTNFEIEDIIKNNIDSDYISFHTWI